MSGRLFAAAAASALLILGSPADAAVPVTGLQSNYWWEGDVSGSAALAPPTVPAGGLWVASDPGGPSAESALRFSLPAGSSRATLTLQVASADPAAAAVVACPATSAWASGPGPSPWSSRPTSDCSAAAVTGTYAPDDRTVSFDLASLLVPGGEVDVVIQAAPLGVGTPAESVTFEPVGPGDVAVAPLAVPASSSSSPAPVPAETPPPAAISTSPSPSFGASGLPVASAGLGGVADLAPSAAPAPAVATPAASAVSAPVASPPAVAPSGGRASTSPSAGLPPSRLVSAPGRSWRDRILLGIAIFDIALYLLYQPRAASPLTRERLRSGPPPALR